MFGFSFDSWADVTGAMYIGVGSEGVWTVIAVIVAIATLALGYANEKAHYDKHQ
ncbi:MAG: hypothetical protein VCA13_01430 [PS1 clade bacterium]|jgi:hypothetical protein|tara:strand:+ start:586 stop:747 length:162 start_codon:yes stop_codon:yes gene_type:complete